MSSFWTERAGPLIALAPMEDVTDTVFRELILGISCPENLHVMMTEFVSTDGLCHQRGREKVVHRLRVNDTERELLRETGVRLVAQIWGKTPELFSRVAEEISTTMEFDGIDINMGCPVPKVVRRGCCSGLIGTPELAQEIIRATQNATELPVSVKTRTGLREAVTEEWVQALLETRPAALTLHGRTQRQQSHGLADWNEIEQAARLRDRMAPEIPILGNGDVLSLAEAHDKASRHQLDGIMIGRGIFSNPWLFNSEQRERTMDEKLQLLWKHTRLFHETWGNTKNFHVLRRYYKIYCNSFPGSADLRTRLMVADGYDDVRAALNDFGVSTG